MADNKVTLGGERLGTGNKMQQDLGYNYRMNSFNQDRLWRSTMAPGVLYPCFKEIGTNHGTFDIDVDTIVRTLPTKGPLFGSFKMQVDLFNVPFRLYQGILHNNPTDIGLHMNEVYLPTLVYRTKDGKNAPKVAGTNEDDEQISTNSLLKYLGLSGAGHHANYSTSVEELTREFQCVPELGYYDIFKNYYSNKQEEKAYVITPGTPTATKYIERVIQAPEQTEERDINPYTNQIFSIYKNTNWSKIFEIIVNKNQNTVEEILEGIGIKVENELTTRTTLNDDTVVSVTINDIPGNKIQITAAINNSIFEEGETYLNIIFEQDEELQSKYYTADIQLSPFKLKNIDKMRAKLLGNCELGDKVVIDARGNDDTNVWGSDSGADETGLPYCACLFRTNEGLSHAAFNMTGLVVKTYQSDMFNNWLDNSLVDTISQRTKIDTTSGGFTPDTLILQEKIYKYLNRVLVSGGTYYDWQEATYGEGVARMCEIPMYIGGMSTEIMFEEVISNNESKIDGKYQALGALAGKGTQTGLKGGQNIHVRMDEPGYIIGICSLTPRISVFQGNEWDRTELRTMDDLHKPELDGIGFQDLMVEQMAWWNTVITPGTTGGVLHRDAVGKQTAWLHYQTAVDKVYGDFAKSDGYSFMVLSRQYEHDGTFGVKDLTTYIDPSKYNYAFAYQDLAAQNFWVSLSFKCVSRRKMGAQQLPTL